MGVQLEWTGATVAVAGVATSFTALVGVGAIIMGIGCVLMWMGR